MSWATVERYYRHSLGRKAAEVVGNPAPRVLGIDEHFFTKKQGFATTLANLGTHKVHDVVLGRSEASLGPYPRENGRKSAHAGGPHGPLGHVPQRHEPLAM
ncbi:MAG: transposase [Myxococcota bacterium]|nr:transposase [Myxococcota bacterium]